MLRPRDAQAARAASERVGHAPWRPLSAPLRQLRPAVGLPLLRLMLAAPGESDTIGAALARNRHGVTPRGSCQAGQEEMASLLDSFTQAREAALRLSLLRDEPEDGGDAKAPHGKPRKSKRAAPRRR